ncbi:hypothetical protein [Salinithrix halophila]|uniref:Uncharacterized protein n=1 Tax=Salinithrix halophila TaxID=1485204 RepID=A0ABV8JDD4_9BACL
MIIGLVDTDAVIIGAGSTVHRSGGGFTRYGLVFSQGAPQQGREKGEQLGCRSFTDPGFLPFPQKEGGAEKVEGGQVDCPKGFFQLPFHPIVERIPSACSPPRERFSMVQ